jgi:pimeloyl-ACP methyl ester carboxylesterase
VKTDVLAAQGDHFLVPVGERVVSWRRFGQGPALLLLHGGHGSWLHWIRTIETMSAHYTVWVPDMPGYGESSSPPENSLPSLASLLASSLAQLLPNDSALSIVGFSFGGLVAAQLALSRAAVVKLVLLGPAGHDGERRPRGSLINWRFAYKSSDHVALEAAMRHNLLCQMLHLDASVDAIAVEVHTQSCIHTRFHSRHISRSKLLMPLLAQISCPVTLIWGEHDVTADPYALREQLSANRVIRNVHIVPNSGHWVQYEAASQVNALMLAL